MNEWCGKSPSEILKNPLVEHSSWHFFQARSWLDYATRENSPSAIHYAAFELRYGIEYLLFQLLLLASDSLTLEEYRRAIGKPHQTKKLLVSPARNYEKLAEFTKIVVSIDSQAPPVRFWNLDELFRYWGVASEFLHFLGPHAANYSDTAWTAKAISRLDSVLSSIWSAVTGTIGDAIMRPSRMEPEIHQAWSEFRDGTLTTDDLARRLEIMKPALGMRRGETGWQHRGRRVWIIPKD